MVHQAAAQVVAGTKVSARAGVRSGAVAVVVKVKPRKLAVSAVASVVRQG